jgi:hypothetical protein
MKTPSNDLFRLIKVMSPIERRQFKAQHGGESSNNTLDLFDIIAKMEQYDEQQAKQQLKDASFAKNLKVHKNRLQQQILSFLRQHKTEPTPAERIREQIDYVEILLQRKLYDMSFDILDKLCKQCETYEEYELLLLVLGLKARQETYFRRDAVKGTIKELQQCLNIIDNYVKQAQVNDLVSSLFIVRDEDAQRVEKINAIISRDILEQGEAMLPKSPVAARMYNHSMSIWRRVLDDNEGCCSYTRANVIVCEANPIVLKEKPMPYFNILINHIIACQNAQKYPEMWDCMSKMEALQARFDYFEPHLLYGYHECILGLKKQMQTDEAIAFFVEKVLPLINKLDLSQTPTALIIYLKTTELFLLRQNYDMVGKIFDILQLLGQDLNHELSDIVLILEAIYYIERGEWIFLQSWTEALQKRIQRQKAKKYMLRMITQFAQKLSSNSPSQHQRIYQKHLDQLEQLNPHQMEDYQMILQSFRYRDWLEAKAKNTDWYRYLSEKKQAKAEN